MKFYYTFYTNTFNHITLVVFGGHQGAELAGA